MQRYNNYEVQELRKMEWVDADIAQEMYDALVDLIGAAEEISGEHVEGWLRLDLATDRARNLLEVVDKGE